MTVYAHCAVHSSQKLRKISYQATSRRLRLGHFYVTKKKPTTAFWSTSDGEMHLPREQSGKHLASKKRDSRSENHHSRAARLAQACYYCNSFLAISGESSELLLIISLLSTGDWLPAAVIVTVAPVLPQPLTRMCLCRLLVLQINSMILFYGVRAYLQGVLSRKRLFAMRARKWLDSQVNTLVPLQVVVAVE